MKYKSKLKRNSKYNPHSKRFLNHARQAKNKIEKGGAVMEIYKCPHCKKFHLTSIERAS